MSTRNFDHRVIVERVRAQTVAQGQFRNILSGSRMIGNPQSSTTTADRIIQYKEGVQTTFERGLLGGGFITSPSGIANLVSGGSTPSIPPSPPTITSITALSSSSLSV